MSGHQVLCYIILASTRMGDLSLFPPSPWSDLCNQKNKEKRERKMWTRLRMRKSLETQQEHCLLSLWSSVTFIPIQVSSTPPSQLKADVGSLATLGLLFSDLKHSFKVENRDGDAITRLSRAAIPNWWDMRTFTGKEFHEVYARNQQRKA